MRDTDDLQTTIDLGPVNRRDQTLSLELVLRMELPMPRHDEHLPDRIETLVHRAGLEVQRRLFQALIEKADRELVFQLRRGDGGAGIQRRGTRPHTFKTIFGEVVVRRSRISHNRDGAIETPTATAWATSRQLSVTGNLRDAVCDRMGDLSAAESRAEIGRDAGEEDLLGRSTVIDVVHREGAELIAASHARARAILDDATAAQLDRLGPAADFDAPAGSADDDPPRDGFEEDRDDGPVPAEWIATGFPGCEPAPPADDDRPRGEDEGFVIVQPDEVKTKAQATTGRKEIWTYTAVVMAAGLRRALADATAEGLWLQVAALLLESGVLDGRRRLLVLGDGASWLRAWFEGLRIDPKAMIVCWWHLRKRCYEDLSSAGGPKDRRRALAETLRDSLWEGKVDEAIERLREAMQWVRTPKALEGLIGYLEKRREYLPDYGERRRAGLWIASTRVEKFNDWAVSERCKHRGMSWTTEGVLALAVLEAARRNGELAAWRRDRRLPDHMLPGPWSEAA